MSGLPQANSHCASISRQTTCTAVWIAVFCWRSAFHLEGLLGSARGNTCATAPIIYIHFSMTRSTTAKAILLYNTHVVPGRIPSKPDSPRENSSLPPSFASTFPLCITTARNLFMSGSNLSVAPWPISSSPIRKLSGLCVESVTRLKIPGRD